MQLFRNKKNIKRLTAENILSDDEEELDVN